MKEVAVYPIINMMVMLTNQCNLRCPYCFVNKDIERMTYDTLFSVVQFLIKNAEKCNRTPRIVFFGGEPTLEWDTLIVPIVQYIRQEYKKSFIINMTTNITLMNEEKLKFMKDNEVYSLYSIDGNKETSAINRPFASGNSAFDIIDQNIDKIIHFFPKAPARITLYKKTMNNFFEDLLYVTGKGFGRISVLPNLFDIWDSSDEAIFKEQIRLYGNWLINEFRQHKTPIIFQQYEEMFFKLMYRNRCVKDNKTQTLLKCHGCGKCGFGLNYHATCDTKGNIFGCLHLESLSADSIFYLGDIYNGVSQQKTLSLIERCDNEPLGGLDCANCMLAEVCDRGCAPNNYLYNGTFNIPPPIFCQFYRDIAENALHTIRVLGEEKNEVFKKAFQERVIRG